MSLHETTTKNYLDSKIGYFNKADCITTLYVGNLDFDKNEFQIKNLFEDHGNVNYVKIVKDKETHKSTGIAFLQMANKKHALIAISKLNGAEVDGRLLKVSIAEEQDENRVPVRKKRRKAYKAYVSKADRVESEIKE